MTPHSKSPMLGTKSNSSEGIHKRTPKACDHCRTKKAKCDGTVPCQKCRDTNTICTFAERKRPRDKVYPKGYINFLEEQQKWLIHGIRELYRRTHEGEGWPGEPLNCKTNGHVLTHDLLARLGSLKQETPEYVQEDKRFMLEKIPEHSDERTQRSESSNGSSQGNAPDFAPPAIPNETNFPPTELEYQAGETDSTSLASPTQDTIDSMSPITLQSFGYDLISDQEIFNQLDLTDPASHINFLNTDIRMSSSMFEQLPVFDRVSSENYTPIDMWYDTSDSGQCLGQATIEPLDTWLEL